MRLWEEKRHCLFSNFLGHMPLIPLFLRNFSAKTIPHNHSHLPRNIFFFSAFFTFSRQKEHFSQTPSRFPLMTFQSLGYVTKHAAAFRVFPPNVLVYCFCQSSSYWDWEKERGVWGKSDFCGEKNVSSPSCIGGSCPTAVAKTEQQEITVMKNGARCRPRGHLSQWCNPEQEELQVPKICSAPLSLGGAGWQ